MAISLNSLQQKQIFLRILVFSLVTVIIWVSFSLFRSQQKTSISQELMDAAKPLNPNINIEVISRIEEKKAYSEAELQNFTIYRQIRLRNGEDAIVTELPSTGDKVVTPVSSVIPTAQPSSSVIPTASAAAVASPTP